MTAPQPNLTFSTIFKGILNNVCPNCLKGQVFSGIYSMNRHCPVCGQAFEKEPGYFLGAMVTAYFIGAFSLVPTLIVLLFILHVSLVNAVTIGTIQILVMHPFLHRFSKLAWLFIETRLTHHLDK